MRLSGFVVRKFRSAAQEHAFLVDYARRFAGQRRIAATGAIFFPASIGIDWWLLHSLDPGTLLHAVAARLVGTAGMGTAVWFIWGPRAYEERAAFRILSAGALSCWLSILWLMTIYPTDLGFRLHFSGLLLALFLVFTLFRLRAIVAAWLGGLCVASFYLTELFLYLAGRMNVETLVFNLVSGIIFLALEYLIGIVVCVQFELAARRDFMFRRTLRAAKARVDAASAVIRQKNQRMEEMVREKERFFSSAYHDIQQPLAAINLFIRSAGTKLGGDNGASHDLNVIADIARDILDMFKDIQEYSELGSYTPHLSPINTQAVLTEVCEQYLDAASSRGIEFRTSTRRRRPPSIESDRSLIKRALSNFVSNAIKNTSTGGVVVGWVQIGERLRIDVWDTGSGIAPEHRDAIFTEYYQINNPGRDRSKGLGLGLSIVHRVIGILPRHSMRFWSVKGRGSRFSLYAPISTNAPVLAVDDRTGGAATSILEGRYVVLCEDEPIVLEGLRRLFVSAGALVDAAESLAGFDAMLGDDGRVPDVIVTDIRLRDGPTGIEVAQRIRQHFAWSDVIPVAFITGELVSPRALCDFAQPFVLLRKSSSPESTLVEVSRLVAGRSSRGFGPAQDP